MGCLTITTTLSQQADVSVGVTSGASLGMQQATPAVPGITLIGGAELTLGEVCSVNSGTIVVFAGSDGPFRTRDGGYILLDPATSPAE